jgi:S-adenosylmethionine hydrolase
LTDFGHGYFQGVMKGVILRRCPGASIVDLDHHVPPGDVAQAAYVLESAHAHFPATSVFCCVVDPGVGTGRRRLLVEAPGGQLAVGPDNGVLSALLRAADARVREIANPDWSDPGDPNRTFEGRSRFAPAAASLAAGADPADAGPLVGDARIFSDAATSFDRGRLRGTVIYADAFGNLVTSIRAADLDRLGSRESLEAAAGPEPAIPVRATYGDVPPGSLLAYVGSTGHLELAVRGANAASRLALGVGAPVTVGPRGAPR